MVRLVANGIAKKGVGLEDVFSSVSRLERIRSLNAMIALRNYHIELIDVKTVFRNIALDERIYVRNPELTSEFKFNYPVRYEKPVVWKLCGAIYGLRQLSFASFLNLKPSSIDIGLMQGYRDPYQLKTKSIFFYYT